MGKYKIEVTRIQTATKTFEVEADTYEAAMDLAEQNAADSDYSGLGNAEYESFCIESPEDRGECPECGTILVDATEDIQKLHSPLHIKTCTGCGNDYTF